MDEEDKKVTPQEIGMTIDFTCMVVPLLMASSFDKEVTDIIINISRGRLIEQNFNINEVDNLLNNIRDGIDKFRSGLNELPSTCSKTTF